jgi:8-oxo-dGTP pyrophosphatase MutT (NUDIX family)
MEIRNREAALCVIRRDETFLVSEVRDPHNGRIYHRPPGGGIEPGELPEQAVRREVLEELNVTLTEVEALGPLDHVWIWKSREVHERAWIFVADATDDARLDRGETPELIEADGDVQRTLWRALDGGGSETLPPLSPANLLEFLRRERR